MFLTEWFYNRRLKKIAREITALKDQLFELKKERLRIKNSKSKATERDSRMDKNKAKIFNLEVRIKVLENKLKGSNGSDR